MKRKKTLFIALSASLMCAAAAVGLAACGDDETPDNQGGTPNPTPETPAVTKYHVNYSAGTDITVEGTLPTEPDHAKGETVTVKAGTGFTYADHEFNGWLYGANTYNEGDTFSMPESDVTLTAKWLELFTVTYEWDSAAPAAAYEGVTLPEATKIADGKNVTLTPLTAATGYTFAGWKVKGEDEVISGTQYTIDANTTLVATFTANEYNVTYSLGEHAAESATAPATVQKAVGSVVALPETEPAAADGWAFTGWTVKKGEESVTVTSGTFVMPAGAVTVTANWADASTVVTVTFLKNSDDETAYQTVNAVSGGTLANLPANPTKDGHRFDKWMLVVEDGTDVEFTTETTIEANATVYATWVETVTVDYALGAHAAETATAPEAATVDKDGTVTLPAAPAAAEGYEFAGWKVGDTETVLDKDATTYEAGASVTLTATWNEKTFKVVLLENEDDEEGTELTGAWSKKLSEIENYSNSNKDANGFTIKEWAVQGNAEVTATSETLVSALVNSAVEGTITLVPVSSSLEVGVKGNTAAYPGLSAAWNTTIQKGEKVVLTGKMTSAGTGNFQSVFAYIWSEQIKGLFRADDWILDDGNVGAGADLSAAEHWAAIVKDDSAYNPGEWDGSKSANLVAIFASCDITVTLNWISDSQMILTIATTGNTTTNNTLSSTVCYKIAPAEGQSFAESYKFGLNAEASYAEFTEFTRHTHEYGATTDLCECGIVNPNHGGEGGLAHDYDATTNQCKICGQANPVHQHNYVNGVCSVCNEICLHTNTNEGACTDCGATLANSALTVNNTNWWSSSESADQNIAIGVNEMLIFNMQYTNFTAAEWAGAILTIRDSSNTLLWVNRYIDGWNNVIATGKTATMPADGNTMIHNTDDNATLPETRLQIIVLRGEGGVLKVICNKYAKGDTNLATVLVTRTFELTGFTEEGLKFGIANADNSAFVDNTVSVVKATYTA